MEYCSQIYFKASRSLHKVTPTNTKLTIISKIGSILSEVLWARNFVFRQQEVGKGMRRGDQHPQRWACWDFPEDPVSHCQTCSKRQARSVATSSISFKTSNFLPKTPCSLELRVFHTPPMFVLQIQIHLPLLLHRSSSRSYFIPQY